MTAAKMTAARSDERVTTCNGKVSLKDASHLHATPRLWLQSTLLSYGDVVELCAELMAWTDEMDRRTSAVDDRRSGDERGDRRHIR